MPADPGDMPSGIPLSPTPTRFRSPSEPHPDFAALLSSFESGSQTAASEHGGQRSGRQESTPHSSSGGGTETDYLTAPGSPTRDVPEIRTTSPTPLRPGLTASPALSSSKSTSEGRLSPLPTPPLRGRLFGDQPGSTDGRFLGVRGASPQLQTRAAGKVPSLSFEHSLKLV